jgi:hypothetical protein
MGVMDWLLNWISSSWTGQHRAAVEKAISQLPDGRLIPVVRVRNRGKVRFWIDAVGGQQEGRVFVIPDQRLPVLLEPDGPWMTFPVVMDATFLPEKPWVAIVREPSGAEHRSN